MRNKIKIKIKHNRQKGRKHIEEEGKKLAIKNRD